MLHYPLSVRRGLAAVCVLGSLLTLLFGPALPGAAAHPAAAHPTAAPQACGTVETRAAQPPQDAAAQQAETCFWQAYQQSQPATLTLRVVGVDTVTTHAFTLDVTGATRTIKDSVQTRLVVGPTPVTNVYTCSGLSQKDGGLLVSGCGAAGDVVIPAPAGAGSPGFADPSFMAVWTRTDSLVASHRAARSWFWGPGPNTGALQEPYKESPGGQRLVQYFDKSRMEINDPRKDSTSPFYVTNGLLVVEMISGRAQVGDSTYETRGASKANVSGDADDATAPTYQSFQGVANTPAGDHAASGRTGQLATATLSRAGQVGDDPGKSKVPGIDFTYFEPTTKHNIPTVFWDFLNQHGPVIENSQVVTKQVILPWFYASGFPISEPYWATVKVAGKPTDVLIQAYERRVLTYTPTNAAPFQVEMGNVGAHYYNWRYKTPTPIPALGVQPAFGALLGFLRGSRW